MHTHVPMICKSDSGIGIEFRFQGFSGMMESGSEWNQRLKLQEGIGIVINRRLKSLEGIGIGIELSPFGIGIIIYLEL